MMTTRRSFISGTGLGLLSFTVAGSTVLMSPRDARAKNADFRILSDREVKLIETFGEALVPGARENGIAHFIDQQLSVDANDALLMIKYFNIRPPYAHFYRTGLTALNDYSRTVHDKPFTALDDEAANALITTISNTMPEGWDGPPAPLFYLAVRSDAVDVVYGTVEGFERLGIPYMPHILPPEA
ncbi:MAG TPA: gluconate 2-dehydrogenase subunit 3 family protein [Gammaproteobacteria bacterium]|jgi:hypothetical protein|nr:Tat pathway signal protein [Chromatiales bacterium]MCP4926172.1 gluconate 2-dehydrogenase subunit 3 family protein [Gammaproteobacteria bacterium]HJP38275.1 gluconate 2-dehydrogenase subunit 3 family protein [Gammaproteobacteria bacterium]